MRGVLSRGVRGALLAALAWQGGSAAWAQVERIDAGLPLAWSTRLGMDTPARIRRAIGPDADVLTAVRAAVPARSLLLVAKVMGDPHAVPPERLLQLMAKNGLIDQLSVLLYPDPWVFAVPSPIADTERLAVTGRVPMLLTLPGDEEPVGRAGWSLHHRHERFAVWAFRGA